MANPLWTPSTSSKISSSMHAFMQHAQHNLQRTFADYSDFHTWSVEQPHVFWRMWLDWTGLLYEGNDTHVMTSHAMPGCRFFPDVRLNFAENLLAHGKPSHTALTSISESRPAVSLSYSDLQHSVRRVMAWLKQAGLTPGQRVAAMVANTHEAVVAMLATTALGGVWSSCSPDFGTQGVLDRFSQIQPHVFFAVDGYTYNGKTFSCLEKIQAVQKGLPSLAHTVAIPLLGTHHTPEGCVSWHTVDTTPPYEGGFERFPFNHPYAILYSSGTTGVPKCIVHGAGGTLLQHRKELSLHSNVQPHSVIMYFTTCGWMMWNWLVSALSLGSTVVLYDGSPSYPSLNTLWTLADTLGITHFGTSPKFLGACREQQLSPMHTHSLHTLSTVLSTGSPLLPEDFDWVYHHVKQDVHLASISGGTDIVSCFMLGNPMLPVFRGEIQCKGLGMDVAAYNSQGISVVGSKGELVCRTPFVSMPLGFWNDDAQATRYTQAYFKTFEHVWTHGDFIEITSSQGSAGGIVVYGRSDTTLNPGGVRIGTAEIYRLVETLPEITDSVVVGQPWKGDVRIVLFVQLAPNTPWTPSLEQLIKKHIKEGASPRHVPSIIKPVTHIPYTRSGKKVELAVLHILEGLTPQNTEALQDPQALDEYRILAEEMRA